MSEHRIDLTVNGKRISASVEARLTLADFLRDELELTGTKLGCEHGVCGACTIHMDGRAVRACLLFAVQADGASLLTIEGVNPARGLHPVQAAFTEHHALQCGFCTPGILMSLDIYLRDQPSPTEAEIREFLGGHLCRCTGYVPIVAAALDAAKRLREQANA
jgi:aerobic-type carbon monoxide dehydrogenase small subunit (CoxS/CutS family)